MLVVNQRQRVNMSASEKACALLYFLTSRTGEGGGRDLVCALERRARGTLEFPDKLIRASAFLAALIQDDLCLMCDPLAQFPLATL